MEREHARRSDALFATKRLDFRATTLRRLTTKMHNTHRALYKLNYGTIGHRPSPRLGRYERVGKMETTTALDLAQLRVDASATVLSAVSVSFGFISAYITALYFFLHSAPLIMRAAAFALLTLGLNFVILIAVSLARVAGGILTGGALSELSLSEINSSSIVIEDLIALVIKDTPISHLIAWSIGVALVIAVYIGLFYMTFVMKWRGANQSKREAA